MAISKMRATKQHGSQMTFRIATLASLCLLAGCGDGPPTTRTTSTAFATIGERVVFLERYVRFRRTYQTLDFDVMYQNNSRGMPGPSDWDVRLVATVPSSELQAWIPPGVKAGPAPDLKWLRSVPTTLDLSRVDEWYVDRQRWVGIDRADRIVAYRVASTPGTPP